jgi:multiple antibiotic resistance protein
LQALLSAAAATFLSLFPIVNPIGALPVFVGLTAQSSEGDKRRIVTRSTFSVAVILSVFLFVGRFLLHFFGISLPVLQIAGGLVVGHTAWNMVAGQPSLSPAEHEEAGQKDDISLTPLAMPILAGPGAIGVVIALSAHVSDWSAYPGYVLGIMAIAVVTYLVLRLGEGLSERLGRTGIGVLNRTFGFLILAIAVQLVAKGVLGIAAGRR